MLEKLSKLFQNFNEVLIFIYKILFNLKIDDNILELY